MCEYVPLPGSLRKKRSAHSQAGIYFCHSVTFSWSKTCCELARKGANQSFLLVCLLPFQLKKKKIQCSCLQNLVMTVLLLVLRDLKRQYQAI